MTYEEFTNLSFDDLLALRLEDPKTFEERMRDALTDFIENHIPEEKRQGMRQLQWKIDGELRKFKDPVARMNKMIELFWKGFNEFQLAVNMVKEVRNEG